jgi:hypothetical protein
MLCWKPAGEVPMVDPADASRHRCVMISIVMPHNERLRWHHSMVRKSW